MYVLVPSDRPRRTSIWRRNRRRRSINVTRCDPDKKRWLFSWACAPGVGGGGGLIVEWGSLSLTLPPLGAVIEVGPLCLRRQEDPTALRGNRNREPGKWHKPYAATAKLFCSGIQYFERASSILRSRGGVGGKTPLMLSKSYPNVRHRPFFPPRVCSKNGSRLTQIPSIFVCNPSHPLASSFPQCWWRLRCQEGAQLFWWRLMRRAGFPGHQKQNLPAAEYRELKTNFYWGFLRTQPTCSPIPDSNWKQTSSSLLLRSQFIQRPKQLAKIVIAHRRSRRSST